jgi:hypothetical protein
MRVLSFAVSQSFFATAGVTRENAVVRNCVRVVDLSSLSIASNRPSSTP